MAADSQGDIDYGKHHPLVAIHEWMVLYEAFQERGGLVNESVVVACLGSMKRWLERARIAYASSAADNTRVIAKIAAFISSCRHFVTNISNTGSVSLASRSGAGRRAIVIRRLMLTVIVSGVPLAWAADQAPGSASAPKVFTAAQARAGKIAYESSCGLCHRANLQGRTAVPGELPDVNSLPENMIKAIDQSGGQVPPLVGPQFMSHWGSKSTKEYVARVANAMGAFPPRNVGSDTPVQLTAYFLQMNGGKSGKIPLSAETSVTLNAVTGQSTH
jgi:mono/diheme cytochrome c family protein